MMDYLSDVVVVSSVFELSYSHSESQNHTHTDAAHRYTHATTVGVSN